MRVLMTTDTVGGVWTYTRELVGGLLNHGYEVALVSLGRAPSADQRGWAEQTGSVWGSAFELTATEYPLEWMQDNSGGYDDSCDLLLRIAETFRADVIHCNQFCYGALPAGVPKIVVAHSDVIGWNQSCRPGLFYKDGTDEALWLERYQAIVAAGIHGASAVVAPTRWMLQSLEANHGQLGRSAVIPNGRAVPFLQREQKLQAITAGRLWDEAKNVRMLADVETSVPLLIAGDLEMKGEAMFQATQHELKGATLLGPLSEANLLGLMAESAIYIATSQYEPFGLAPLEAALSGCVLAVNDIPSLREVWADAAVYFHDAASLSRTLGDVSSDSMLRTKMARRALERARAEYTSELMVDKYMRLYQSLIAATPRLEEVTRHVA